MLLGTYPMRLQSNFAPIGLAGGGRAPGGEPQLEIAERIIELLA